MATLRHDAKPRGQRMITSQDFRARTTQTPFEPFRIVTSAGQEYDILHPDLVLIGTRWVIVGMPSNKNPHFAEQETKISLLHVTALENLPAQSKLKKNGQK
jgi:hypothetical protein